MRKKLIKKHLSGGYVAPELHNTGVEIGANNPKIGNAVKTGFYFTPVFGTALSMNDFREDPNFTNGLGLLFSALGDSFGTGLLTLGSKIPKVSKAYNKAYKTYETNRRIVNGLYNDLDNTLILYNRARNKVHSASLSNYPYKYINKFQKESDALKTQLLDKINVYNKASLNLDGTTLQNTINQIKSDQFVTPIKLISQSSRYYKIDNDLMNSRKAYTAYDDAIQEFKGFKPYGITMSGVGKLGSADIELIRQNLQLVPSIY